VFAVVEKMKQRKHALNIDAESSLDGKLIWDCITNECCKERGCVDMIFATRCI